MNFFVIFLRTNRNVQFALDIFAIFVFYEKFMLTEPPISIFRYKILSLTLLLMENALDFQKVNMWHLPSLSV